MALEKSAFNLSKFQSLVLGQGLARTNRFEVFITPPLSLPVFGNSKEKVSLFCEVSNFPPLSLNVRQLRIFGPNFQRPISSDYGGDGISMIFHVDRKDTFSAAAIFFAAAGQLDTKITLISS